MPWQAADAGTVAQDDQGAYHVKVGDSWVPAPKGSIAQDDKGTFHVNSDAMAPASTPAPNVNPPAPNVNTAAPESPSVGAQIMGAGKAIGSEAWNEVKGVVSPIARAAGDVYGAGKNIVNGTADDPTATGDKFAAPFEPAAGSGINSPAKGAGELVGQGLDYLKHTAPYQAVATAAGDSPGARLVGDIAKPVGQIAQGAMAIAGTKGIFNDEAINGSLVGTPSAAQDATIASNPAIAQARAAGYKLTGADVRNAVNAKDADIPGLTRSNITDTGPTDVIQRHNRALATSSAADDVGLGNNRSIDSHQVQMAKDKAGTVYGQVASAVGENKVPTPQLGAELSAAGATAGSRTAQAEIARQVNFYKQQFGDTFGGRNALEAVKSLRENASAQMVSGDPDAMALGRTNRHIANAIEEEMMRQLPQEQAGLRTAFPAARTQLAKLNDLQAVTEGGQVNAAKVLQLRKAGAPLSGAMGDIAHAADTAPESMAQAVGQPSAEVNVGYHGILRTAMNAGGRIIRALPGMDESTDAFQDANYGPRGPVGHTPAVEQMGPLEPQGPLPLPRELAVGSGRASPHVASPGRGGSSGYGEVPPPFELKAPDGTTPSASGRVAGQSELDLHQPPRTLPPAYEMSPQDGPAYEPSQRSLELSPNANQPTPDELSVGTGKSSPTKDAPKAPTRKGMTPAEREQWERDAILGRPRRGN